MRESQIRESIAPRCDIDGIIKARWIYTMQQQVLDFPQSPLGDAAEIFIHRHNAIDVD